MAVRKVSRREERLVAKDYDFRYGFHKRADAKTKVSAFRKAGLKATIVRQNWFGKVMYSVFAKPC